VGALVDTDVSEKHSPSVALTLEAVSCFETSAIVYQATRHGVPEDSHRHSEVIISWIFDASTKTTLFGKLRTEVKPHSAPVVTYACVFYRSSL
jgi:hypothetical protein